MVHSIAEVPEAQVRAYLSSQGIADAIASWKYYDTAFGGGRTRGLAWTRDGRVQGFVGLIPYSLGRNGQRIDACWTCDWSLADPNGTPGMGVKLYQEAAARGLLTSVGGNEQTRRLLPRLATTTEEQAALGLVLDLRLGGALEAAARRIPAVKRLHVLRALPRRWTPPTRATRAAVRTDGVAETIASVLPDGTGPDWTPCYDVAYLRWQLERCPLLRAWTYIVSSADGPASAGLLWRLRHDARRWRVAVWTRPGHDGARWQVLKAVRRDAWLGGAQKLSAIVSSRHIRVIADFRKLGFRVRKDRLPLYVTVRRGAQTAVEGIGPLSYLDTDLGYRFESKTGP